MNLPSLGSLPFFPSLEVFDEAGKFEFSKNITLIGHQRQMLESVLAYYGSLFFLFSQVQVLRTNAATGIGNR